MKHFESRWTETTRMARHAPGRDDSPPLGFATRVAAHVAARATSAPQSLTLEQIWRRRSFGTLATLAAILTACAVTEAPYLRDRSSFNPNVENTVAQLIDRL